MMVWLAFHIRVLLRFLLPHHRAHGGAISDGTCVQPPPNVDGEGGLSNVNKDGYSRITNALTSNSFIGGCVDIVG